ncbi:MAG: sigma-70 family RNA polymerase sigma factor, partial [Candidatus Hydrogenedentes bacterium]|nr:sigma-70 family RNA polymerase sigma factor [Candidatus Hydrogenedentota bacterium]
MNTTANDIALLQNWQRRRDAEAFHTLVDRYAHLVYQTCRHIVKNDADAADVAQECFLSLATTPPDIERSLAGWLHRLATHRALNHLKKEQRRRDREVRYAEALPQPPKADHDDLLELIDEAIDALPDDLRLPLIDHFLRQKTHQEVADGLGIPRRTVSYRIEKGVEQLREHLKEKGVVTSTAVLAAFLETQLAEAAALPEALRVALGKQAVAGTATTSAAPGSLAGLSMLKLGAVLGSIIVLLIGGWWVFSSDDPLRVPPSSSPVADTAQAVNATSPETSPPAITDLIEMEAGPAIVDAAPVANATLAGRVYDKTTDAGIPGVKVTLNLQRGKKSAVTDKRGEYRLEGLPPVSAVLSVGRPDGYYADDEVKRDVAPNASSVAFVDVGLQPGQFAGISGIVLDVSDNPISGAVVTAWSRAYQGGAGQRQESKSSADGHFEIRGLELDAKL